MKEYIIPFTGQGLIDLLCKIRKIKGSDKTTKVKVYKGDAKVQIYTNPRDFYKSNNHEVSCLLVSDAEIKISELEHNINYDIVLHVIGGRKIVGLRYGTELSKAKGSFEYIGNDFLSNMKLDPNFDIRI